MFDQIEPLIANLNRASGDFTRLTATVEKNERFEIMVGSLTDLSMQMAEMMPEMQREVPNMGQQIGSLVNNMAILAEEFKKLTPAISAVAPELPRVSIRAVEALDEAVVTMKAMQKPFYFEAA
ncbi:MAG: hypothetical protein R2827_02450 [Bdellovibrionales bacterium]